MQKKQDSHELLLHSMNELRVLLEKRGSIQEFLSDLVTMVSKNMQSSVCSVYLYDTHRDKLILRATKGLCIDLVDKLELEVGEGITGQCFQLVRPIREGHADRSTYFLPVSGSAEEKYKAFLAVPIRRGPQPVGVITLEHEEAEYFTHQDTAILRAIASHLAIILEDAEFIMELSQEQELDSVTVPPIFQGTGIGQGICIGQGIVFRRSDRSFLGPDPVHESAATATSGTAGTSQGAKNAGGVEQVAIDVTRELIRFAGSLRATKEQLEDIQRSLANSIAEAADLIFSAHILMLKDVSFSDAMQKKIEQGSSVEDAIQHVVNKYVDIFSSQSNPRVQEKVQDILDLGHRLLRNLDSSGQPAKLDFSGQIVVLADTFPSEVVKFAAEKVEGLLILGGGETAHIALLTKSLNLPAIFVKDTAILNLEDNTPLIIDVDEGQVIVNPEPEVIREYEEKKRSSGQKRVVVVNIPERSRTEDGKAIAILANVNLVQDVTYALEQKAEGIGLYRSEFPFLVRNDFPPEEEQTAIYNKIIGPMGKKEVVIRTLDAGGDKFIGYNPGRRETNPFLGYRGIRFSLSNEDIFLEQIRAILRSGRGGNIGILFPMIGSLEELREARNMIYRGMEELQRDGIPFCENPKIGAMLELPSAAEIAGELAEECDFLSIGTNDLIMYVLAVDRTNEKVESLYKPYHPAVLRILNRISDDVGPKISTLSICGEVGSDPALIPFFLGRGIHKLSVAPRKISYLKDYISTLKLSRATKIADEMLALKTFADIETYLQEEVMGGEATQYS